MIDSTLFIWAMREEENWVKRDAVDGMERRETRGETYTEKEDVESQFVMSWLIY